MRTRAALVVLVVSTVVIGVARATDISPTVKASIQDAPVDGLGDTFNALPFDGLLSKGTPQLENRAIQEFDIAPFVGGLLQSATLSGKISVNNSFDVGVRTFDFLLYAGNGVADLSDFQIPAVVVGSGSYHPPMPPNFTYSFDVTSTVQSLINGGATWIGLKAVCTSDPNYPNILDDTTSKLAIIAATITGAPFCPGINPAGPCPCGNDSPAGIHAGCLNSLGVGAVLVASGNASLSNDTLVLSGSSMPNSSALYFQGTLQQSGGAGTVFGDGLRCAGGTVIRLATVTNAGGASQYPVGAQPSISVKGSITSPGVRTYQVWYRNAAAFCTPSTFNLSNGWQVSWLP